MSYLWMFRSKPCLSYLICHIEATEIICWVIKYLLLDVNHNSCQQLLRFLFLRLLTSLLKCVRRWTSLKQFYVTLSHLLFSRWLPYQVMPERLFQQAKYSIFLKGFWKRCFNREVCLLNFSSNKRVNTSVKPGFLFSWTGWEYAVNPTYGVYGAVVKAYHMFRRRRLVRRRELVDKNSTKKQDQLQKLLAEGWGYAPLFNMKFHAKEKKMDFCRRRRWLLKMVPISGEIDGFSCKLPPILRVQLKSKVTVIWHLKISLTLHSVSIG